MTLATLRRHLAKLEARVHSTSEARRALPPGSSRARVTTANARWATACEARDRVAAMILDIEEHGADCPACGQRVALEDGLMAYHDHPPGCRALCPGSKQRPGEVRA